MPPHDLISSIFSSSLFLYPFSWSDKRIKLQSDFDQPTEKKKNRTMLQHTAPPVCSWLSWVPLDETFWRVQVRIVTTVFSGSAEAFEALKRRVLRCLVLLTSDVFAKKLELVFSQSPRRLSPHLPPPPRHWRCTCCTVTRYMMRLCILECVCCFILLQSEQTSTE